MNQNLETNHSYPPLYSNAIIVANISDCLPALPFNVSKWIHIANLSLADRNFNIASDDLSLISWILSL